MNNSRKRSRDGKTTSDDDSQNKQQKTCIKKYSILYVTETEHRVKNGDRHTTKIKIRRSTGKVVCSKIFINDRLSSKITFFDNGDPHKILNFNHSTTNCERFRKRVYEFGNTCVLNMIYTKIDGVKKGKGTATYAGGCKYEGEYENSKRHGKGTVTYANGDKYEGDWVNNERHGKGTFTSTIGSKYEGDWVNNMRQGKGTTTYTDGCKYEGDWENNMRQGKGTLTHINGGKYEGDWKNDKCHGKGTVTYADGSKYEGNLENNKFIQQI